ncbi:hypothetical protein [Desulfovibrio legallii]|uniref:Transcriptional activator TraM n=1 Tax=Desulfovibrio legallii TaxID=571438 RepID=A0A1G7KB62_9BACT|nr:hypothetical protein [Desulfovibrio legallii]SDF34214.1 hypothetical protein SAMN05192586_10431 [Desulfovibrio legallii]
MGDDFPEINEQDIAQVQPDVSVTEPAVSQQALPDGFGLSVEDVRALLAKKHEMAVPKDDPLLMMVTIQNAFLEAQTQLQKKHEKALAAFMSEQTAAYVKGVEESMADVSKTLSGVTLEGLQQASSGFVSSLTGFKTSLYLCTAVMALSALINVAVFVLKAVQHG